MVIIEFFLARIKIRQLAEMDKGDFLLLTPRSMELGKRYIASIT